MTKITPLRAIRRKCLECTGGHLPSEVKNCTNPDCPLYHLRMGRGKKGISPLKQIRKHCLECMGGSYVLVKECCSTNCPIHQYRFGHNPKRKGIGGDIVNKKAHFLPELV